jgi:TolB-like protein/DNA-binding winged helix-turn-helix (wHTH) protein
VVITIFEFGDFKLDCDRFELFRAGRTVKLERKPMELLILLATRNGHLVTRAEIAERLWASEVFVDTEHGINTAIRKIRQVLRDDPNQPRFVQTVTGKGYRFVIQENGASKASENGDQVPSSRFLPAEVTLAETLPVEGRPAPALPEEAAAVQVHAEKSAERSRVRSSSAMVVGAFCILGIAALWLSVAVIRRRLFPPGLPSQIHSIAVIPLVNLSGDASQDYFADGMTDELITMLAKNTSLRVVSRTSVMQYKSAQRPVREIARDLGVDGILEGSVARSANRVHMNVQLIFAPTDSHVWAESYNRNLDQAFSLPSELSQTIARQVKTATSPSAPPRYINPEAHDAYLHGRYFWFNFDTTQSLPYFEKAIQLQPDYAAAWSGLADTYSVSVFSDVPARQVRAKALEAARKAVELDDSLPEAHNSMAGVSLYFARDLPRAESESRRAIELNPSYAEGHFLRHDILAAMNRFAEAVQEAKRSVELDPFARPWALGEAYLEARQFDAALTELRWRAQALPNDSSIRFYLSIAYWFKGMWKESQQELEKAFELSGRPEAAAAAHRSFETGGEKAVERWGADDIKDRARKHYMSPYQVAYVVAFARDKDETLKILEDAYREDDAGLIGIQTEPIFDFLHSEPRYRALVKKLGLPPAD